MEASKRMHGASAGSVVVNVIAVYQEQDIAVDHARSSSRNNSAFALPRNATYGDFRMWDAVIVQSLYAEVDGAECY